MIIFTDNSNWNGDKNWQKELDAGAQGTILRASHGLNKDLRYDKYKSTCSHKNIGSYNYFDYRGDGADQCKKFLDITGNYGNIRGVVDLEDNYANGWPKLDGMIGTALSRLMAWVDQYILETGHNPIAYLNTGLTIKKDRLGKYIFRNFVSKCGLWVANYNQSIYINGSWIKMETPPTGAWSECAMWQYTSKGDGYLYGNETGSPYIDLNRVLNLQLLLKPGIVLDPPPVVTPPLPPNTTGIVGISQQNELYKYIQFGDTNIGNNGCILIDIVMLLKYLGVDIDPQRLVDWLKANGGLYGNLFVWKSIEKLLPGLTFIAKYTGGALDKIDESLSRKMPCLVHVDFNPGTYVIDQHWILIVDKVDGRYVAIDPKDGMRIWFDERYGDPLTNIYNVSTYSYSEVPIPPNTPKTKIVQIGKTLVDYQNLRKLPSLDAPVITKTMSGKEVEILAFAKDVSDNSWVRLGPDLWAAQQIGATRFVEQVYV